MHGRFLHPSAGGRKRRAAQDALTSHPASDTEITLHRALASADRACCCPARPVVMAVIPCAAERPAAVDILLCGHHFRRSKDALQAVGAIVHDSRMALTTLGQRNTDAFQTR